MIEENSRVKTLVEKEGYKAGTIGVYFLSICTGSEIQKTYYQEAY